MLYGLNCKNIFNIKTYSEPFTIGFFIEYEHKFFHCSYICIKEYYLGGVRLSAEENVFTFDIHEALYFRENQKIQDMINISLHPEITIQQYDEYVSIRGVLELTGEYILDDVSYDVYEETLEDLSKRYVANVEKSVNNQAVFSHLFPVEISVPTYRVANFDDITVAISDFDYEINDQKEMVLRARMNIYGIDPTEEQEEKALYEVQDSTQFELERLEPFEEEREEVEEDIPLFMQDEEKAREENKVKIDITEIEEEVEGDVQQIIEENVEREVEGPEAFEEEQEIEPLQLDFEVAEERSEKETEEEIEEDLDKVEEIGKNFLSRLFKDAEEENSFTKVRLCFVQSGDTIESIADRYEIPTLQIVQYNELEDGDLYPGELLYIPEKRKRK